MDAMRRSVTGSVTRDAKNVGSVRFLKKRGAVYTAISALFLVTLLVFAVIVARVQEQAEEFVPSNSAVSRLATIEGGAGYVVQQIYERILELTFDSQNIRNTTMRLHFNTTLINTSTTNWTSFSGNLSALATVMPLESSLDDDLLVQTPLVLAAPGIGVNKSSSPQSLIVYYNFSDDTTGLYAINVHVSGYQDMRGIDEEFAFGNPMFSNPSQKYRLNISYNDLDYLASGGSFQDEDPDQIEDYSFRTFSSGDVYQWHIEENSTLDYISIWMDHEKINVTVVPSTLFNVSVIIQTDINETYSAFRTYVEPLTLNFRTFNLTKDSSVVFI